MSQQDKFVTNKDIIFAESEWNVMLKHWLWDDDWYIGPMRGMIEYNGKMYYAHCFEIAKQDIKPEINIQDTDSNSYPTLSLEPMSILYKFFCVYKLKEDRLEYQEYWHQLHDMIMDIAQRPEVVNHDVYTKFYMGREAADYIPLDLESGRDGEVVGWFIEEHEVRTAGV